MQNEMRNRLVNLINQDNCPSPFMCFDKCKYAHLKNCRGDRLADHLIENGVIVPPCKVGDTVYYPYEYGGKILEKTIKKIVIEKEYRWLDVGVSFLPFENIGKTVFLTKEEAEQKLKETRDNDGSL